MPKKLKVNVKAIFIKTVEGLHLQYEVKEIAEKTGYAKGNISNYLNRQNQIVPTRPFLIAFCKAFNLDFPSLFEATTSYPQGQPEENKGNVQEADNKNPPAPAEGSLSLEEALKMMVEDRRMIQETHSMLVEMHKEMFSSVRDLSDDLAAETATRTALQRATFEVLEELTQGRRTIADLDARTMHLAGIVDQLIDEENDAEEVAVGSREG